MLVPDSIRNGDNSSILAGQIIALSKNVAVKVTGDFDVIIENDGSGANLDVVVRKYFDLIDSGGFGESGHVYLLYTK
jgi:hypothetical protein